MPCRIFSFKHVWQADKEKKVFYTLRVARSDAKLIGKREVRAKKKAQEEADAAKTKA
jgi:hypothetical protein